MANVKVALLRYCGIESGWRRLRVNPFRKGRGWGEDLRVPKGKKILKTGAYQLRWYEGREGALLRRSIPPILRRPAQAWVSGTNGRRLLHVDRKLSALLRN